MQILDNKEKIKYNQHQRKTSKEQVRFVTIFVQSIATARRFHVSPRYDTKKIHGYAPVMILNRLRVFSWVSATSMILASFKRGEAAFAKCTQTILNGSACCMPVEYRRLEMDSNIPPLDGVIDEQVPGHIKMTKPFFWLSTSSAAPEIRKRTILICVIKGASA